MELETKDKEEFYALVERYAEQFMTSAGKNWNCISPHPYRRLCIHQIKTLMRTPRFEVIKEELQKKEGKGVIEPSKRSEPVL